MGKFLEKGYNWQALGMVRPQLEVQKMTWEFCNVLWFWTLFNLKDYRKRIWDKKKVHLPSQLAELESLETKNKYLTRGYTGVHGICHLEKLWPSQQSQHDSTTDPSDPSHGKALCIDQDLHSLTKNLPGATESEWSIVIRLLSKVFRFFCDIEWISNGIEKMFNSGINCWILPSDGICINICINGQYAAAWRHSWLLCPPHWQENLAENLICSSLGVWITLISYYYYACPICDTVDSIYSNKRHLPKFAEIWVTFGPVALALFAELECANLFENANYANWNVATCKHEVARSLPLCILPLAKEAIAWKGWP